KSPSDADGDNNGQPGCPVTPRLTATTNAIWRPWWFLTALNGVAIDYCIRFCGRTEEENATNAPLFQGKQVCPPPPANPRQEEHEQAFSVKERFFAAKGWPLRQEKFAARTSKTGKTSAISRGGIICFSGIGMVPKLQMWQSFLTT